MVDKIDIQVNGESIAFGIIAKQDIDILIRVFEALSDSGEY